jgi:hypothetical protein
MPTSDIVAVCRAPSRVVCAARRNMAVGLSFSYTHDRAVLQQHIHSLETRAEQLGSELQQRAEAGVEAGAGAGAAGEAPLLQRQGEQELAECMKHGSALRAWRHQRASTAGLSGASELGAGRTQAAIEAGTAALTRMMSA